MRHVFLRRPITAGAQGMAKAPRPARLVAPAGRLQGRVSGAPCARTRAVPLTPVTAAAYEDLRTAARAQEKSGGRLQRALPDARVWLDTVRVTRRRFASGWLNRTSLLYRQKGRGGGSGAYRGARWHHPRELLDFFSGLRVRRLAVHSAIFLPSGNRMARAMEWVLPHTLPWGGLVVISGEVG